jgi:hypothetical protein
MEQTMTNVLKLLGGGWLAAVLGVALFAMSGALNAPTVDAQSPPNPPARFVGTVLVDGQAPAAGTLIEARVGSATCGVATTFQSGSESRYSLDVQALEPAAPNCGVDGSVVTFYIGGKLAAQTGSWKNYELNQLNLTYTTPTATVTATPKAPTTGETLAQGGTSANWLFAAMGLGAIAFGASGLAVARRSR